MYQPLVSVVMATYNGAAFLAKQLDSIVNQTYSNIEVIVVDDKSTDGTALLVNSYVEKCQNVRLFVNDQNLGYVKNFEKGFLLAKGEIIAPCDQDDIWDIRKIELLLAEMGTHEIVYCNSSLIDGNDHPLHKKLSDIKTLRDFDTCLNFTIGNTPAGHAMLINKSLIQRCIPFPTMVPHDFWLGFVATCVAPIKYVDQVLVQYRQHNSNVFGAVKVEGGKKVVRKKNSKATEQALARERMRWLYEKCPQTLSYQKAVLYKLYTSYQSFSLVNNWVRMVTFFKNWEAILAYKKKPTSRKLLFCLKMFVMIK
jgi:glycosyltransferase involved in cell wall biosynthesis